MEFNKKIFLILIVCSLILNASITRSDAAVTIIAENHSYNDVKTAISNANYGDTVFVPAGDGTETWASQLVITKGIALKGPGESNLTITNTSGDYIIKYIPDATSRSNDYRFEVSGFTFSGGAGISLISDDYANVVTNILIHDNTFLAQTSYTLLVGSYFYGVFYNNTITSSAEIVINLQNGGRDAWENFSFLTEIPNAFYIEDNDFTYTKAAPQPIATSHGALPYVVRYNNHAHTGDGHLGAWFDLHGNQGTDNVYSALGAIIYGNINTKTYNTTRGDKFYPRGGITLSFFNKTNSSYGPGGSNKFTFYEEILDTSNPTTGAFSSGYSQVDGQPQKITNTYEWNNRWAPNEIYEIEVMEYCSPEKGDVQACDHVGSVLAADREFWTFVPSGFDGTTGVGCGTLANRPATCTPGSGEWPTTGSGPGYFATTADCTQVSDDNIGANPKTPISGTLYQCTATDTWTAYYTPYTYPHPLRVSSVLPVVDTSESEAVIK